jgi:hypothetical protein
MGWPVRTAAARQGLNQPEEIVHQLPTDALDCLDGFHSDTNDKGIDDEAI